MNAASAPPAGLRWVGGPVGRTAAMVLAVVSLVLSLYIGYRYVGLIDCLQSKTTADSKRTAALAGPTDAERAAERALLAPGGNPRAELDATLAAHDAVDRARRDNPPPADTACS